MTETPMLTKPADAGSPRPLPTRRPGRRYRALEPSRAGKAVRAVLLAIASLVTIFPFYAMVVLALKPPVAVKFPSSLAPTGLTFDAFRQVLRAQDILRWTVNTLIYSAVSVVAVLLLASMAGYAFAKKRFPGREVIFWSFLSMVMVPYHVVLIPTFILMAKLNGVDTMWGLIVPTLANAQAVFLMRQFIMGLPDELFEAAQIDGCSEWRMFVQIVLPLCKPVLAALGTFIFLWHWNDFLWPLIMGQSTDNWTLTVGIQSMQRQLSPLDVILAGAVISFIPIFVAYLFGQRYFTEGVTMSGIKG
jgi:multiple sugar transport system permease protein